MSKLFNSEDVLTPFNFEKSKGLLNKLCYFGSSKTELIANIVKDNKMVLKQKFDGGIDCYCAENNEWYSFCIPCYKVKAKEIDAQQDKSSDDNSVPHYHFNGGEIERLTEEELKELEALLNTEISDYLDTSCVIGFEEGAQLAIKQANTYKSIYNKLIKPIYKVDE